MSFNAPAKARTAHYRMLYPQILRSSLSTPGILAMWALKTI